MRPDHATDVRRALTDPVALCERLGLKPRRQSRGALICCPEHGERNPSCGVTPGPDGTLRVRCFACQWTGDALTLIACVRGLDLLTDFAAVLAEGAELGGLHSLAEQLRAGAERPNYEPPPAPTPIDPIEYPERSELAALWRQTVPVGEDRDACRMLVARRIDPELVDERNLARVIPADAELPDWATYRRRPWLSTGHRLLVPVYDETGTGRSVRAWRLSDGDSPKRLPPTGKRAAGLVLANGPARAMLRGKARPTTVLVVEGEPDMLTVSTRRTEPVIGIVSGSLTEDVARRIPRGIDVFVWTHHDDAGNRYARRIAELLERRCAVWRAA